MSDIIKFSISKTLKFDTVVIGGGVAGSAAAISSARLGAKTLLVESDGSLGGQAGVGLVTPLSSVRSARLQCSPAERSPRQERLTML